MNMHKQHLLLLNQLEAQRKRIAELEEQVNFLFDNLAAQSNKLETLIKEQQNKNKYLEDYLTQLAQITNRSIQSNVKQTEYMINNL